MDPEIQLWSPSKIGVQSANQTRQKFIIKDHNSGVECQKNKKDKNTINSNAKEEEEEEQDEKWVIE